MDINNIYFYLLLGVFLYFLFTYILENYLVEQENFDPSLVPVSSIVTLAKVAQKLVNGNGTLTNPGNLQIGKDSGATSGSLTVTGKTAIGSTTMGDKTLNVTGTLGVSNDTTISGKTVIKPAGIPSTLPVADYPDLAVGGSMVVVGNTTVGGNTELSGLATSLLVKKGTASPDNTKIQFGDGSGWRLRFQKDDANPIMDIVDNKNVNVHGNTTVGGRLTIPHSVWHQSSDGKNRLHFGNNSHTHFGTGDKYIWRSSADTDLMELNGVGNLKVTGTILNGHTYVATITPTPARIRTTTNVWSGNPLVSDVDYLAEAHIYFVRHGMYNDGITGYFCYEDGMKIGLPFAAGFISNVIDLGGGAGVPRSSAIATIKGGTRLYFQMNNNGDDEWIVSGLIIFKPCNLIV